MKRCPRCRATKSFSDFPRNRSARDGLGNYCKPCHNEVVKANRIKNHGSRENYLLSLRYGIDSSIAEEVLLQQEGRCPVCGAETPKHVDHCHDSGEVRGILCFNCNGALGRFEDDPERMGRAIEYLERHGS